MSRARGQALAALRREPSLFDSEHVDEQIESVGDHADPAWVSAAMWFIRSAIVPGREFLAEEVTEAVARRGLRTDDFRAMGAVIRQARKDGLIERAGFAPASSSHGSPKTLWRRVAAS